MTTKGKSFKHKIDSKINSLSKSDNPQRDAKKLEMKSMMEELLPLSVEEKTLKLREFVNSL